MNPLNQPPLTQKLIDAQGGVDRTWFGWFLQLYQLFSASSYGPKTITIASSGVTGAYTSESEYITDRNFVWFSIELTPTTNFTAYNAAITGLVDLPVEATNILMSFVSTGITLDSRVVSLGTDGIIHIPDFVASTYKLVISGQYLKTF